MTIPDSVLGVGTGIILLGFLKIMWEVRGYADKIRILEVQSHTPPCAGMLEGIKAAEQGVYDDIEAMKKENIDDRKYLADKINGIEVKMNDLDVKLSVVNTNVEHLLERDKKRNGGA